MFDTLGNNFDMSCMEVMQEGLARLYRHTRDLQEDVMQIRMLPISFAFCRFRRLVHDLSTKLGKKIQLKTFGEQTEVDKAVIGKACVHRGGNIVIEVRDDGRGLGRDRILSKAVDRGLVSSDELLSDQQVFDLILQPGFFRAEQVSDVSVRGLGTGVVRRNVNELGGSIEKRWAKHNARVPNTPGYVGYVKGVINLWLCCAYIRSAPTL